MEYMEPLCRPGECKCRQHQLTYDTHVYTASSNKAPASSQDRPSQHQGFRVGSECKEAAPALIVLVTPLMAFPLGFAPVVGRALGLLTLVPSTRIVSSGSALSFCLSIAVSLAMPSSTTRISPRGLAGRLGVCLLEF